MEAAGWSMAGSLAKRMEPARRLAHAAPGCPGPLFGEHCSPCQVSETPSTISVEAGEGASDDQRSEASPAQAWHSWAHPKAEVGWSLHSAPKSAVLGRSNRSMVPRGKGCFRRSHGVSDDRDHAPRPPAMRRRRRAESGWIVLPEAFSGPADVAAWKSLRQRSDRAAPTACRRFGTEPVAVRQ